MKEKFIKVVKVSPKEAPTVCHLENDLTALQEAVSIGAHYRGLIEIVNIDNDTCILCNEEGKYCLEPNRRFGNDILCGVFYVTGQDKSGNLTSLTDEAIKHYKNRFAKIEEFTEDDFANMAYIDFYICESEEA